MPTSLRISSTGGSIPEDAEDQVVGDQDIEVFCFITASSSNVIISSSERDQIFTNSVFMREQKVLVIPSNSEGGFDPPTGSASKEPNIVGKLRALEYSSMRISERRH